MDDHVALVDVPGVPPYAYTKGLHAAYDHPELLIGGLRPEQRAALLELAAELVRNGERFRPGIESWKLARGYPARFRALDPAVAVRAAAELGADVPVLQMFWPDRAGRFPWMDGSDPAVADAQRIQL